MSTDIKNEWLNVTNAIPEPVREKWWTEIFQKYNETGRDAHNISYLGYKFEDFNTIRPLLANVNAFILALFFQYLHYDSKDSDISSKNLESFEKFATEAGLFETDSELYEKTKELLDMSSAYSTEEHLVDGVYGDKDKHYFLDLEMLCLGLEPEKYEKHSQAIAQEYAFLDPKSYKQLRKKVLTSFLLIPNIYATKELRDKYEEKARENINQELNQLKK